MDNHRHPHGTGPARRLGSNLAPLGTVFATLALLPAQAADAPANAVCDTGRFAVTAAYPGARANGCRVHGERDVALWIEPEDQPPINPSPWYGFHVRAHAGEEPGTLRVALRYAMHEHRYAPWTSIDGESWQTLPADARLVGEDGATLVLRPGRDGLFVSAQENINLDQYRRWREALSARHPELRWQSLGDSVAGRPIWMAETDPDANAYLLLLGRQHPPEVPGALALRSFAEHLLADRVRACAGAASPRCAFYRQHSIVLIPNLNPDGVALGHWRHNLGGTDLNRDWGPFTQPETQAVQALVDRWLADGRKPRLVLDYHATHRNVFYTQMLPDTTEPPAFAARWLRAARASGDVYDFEEAPRALSESATAKNYFYRRFGVPAITYEVGDATDRSAIAASAAAFADAMVSVLDPGSALAHRQGTACPDFFCYLVDANKASLVMLVETGLTDRSLAASIAGAIGVVAAEQNLSGAARSANYLDFEARLIELAGEEASTLHLGRSRQDLHGVVRRMLVRDQWLLLLQGALAARDALLGLATDEAHTPMPAYTHGVAAQPTTVGHYLLAFSAALGRDAERFRQGYLRMNRSPLGAAALGTSGFAVDSERLAELLGFAAPVDNSFDANFISSGDMRRELASILALSAIPIGQFVENLHTQYHDPKPWITLAGSAVSGSSIMPQKRNPRPLDRLRSQASLVLASAQAQQLLAHNVNTGMHDYRQLAPITALTDAARLMYRRYAALPALLRVDGDRALDEIDAGYSTMTEVADTLHRHAGTPFRKAHRYASALADFARRSDRRTASLTDRELRRIHAEALDEDLPVPAATIRAAFDAAAMIDGRRGTGGPQPAEVMRALGAHRQQLAADEAWLGDTSAALRDAALDLHLAFADLLRE